MVRPRSARITRAALEFGEHLSAWRRLQSLTSAQVAERAGISRGSVSKIENGDPGVSFESVLRVARALGILDALLTAADPYESDLGRARADQVLPRRIRT